MFSQHISKLNIISTIEKTTQNLPEEHQQEFRNRSKLILDKQHKIKQNLSKPEQLTIGVVTKHQIHEPSDFVSCCNTVLQ